MLALALLPSLPLLQEEIVAQGDALKGKHVRLREETEPAPLRSGIPASHFERVAGLLSDEEGNALLQAIEEGCERIERGLDFRSHRLKEKKEGVVYLRFCNFTLGPTTFLCTS